MLLAQERMSRTACWCACLSSFGSVFTRSPSSSPGIAVSLPFGPMNGRSIIWNPSLSISSMLCTELFVGFRCMGVGWVAKKSSILGPSASSDTISGEARHGERLPEHRSSRHITLDTGVAGLCLYPYRTKFRHRGESGKTIRLRHSDSDTSSPHT